MAKLPHLGVTFILLAIAHQFLTHVNSEVVQDKGQVMKTMEWQTLLSKVFPILLFS